MGIAWQQSAYNQPPHLGYYLPEAATTVDVSTTEDQLFYDPEELAGEGVKHEKIADGTISWTMNSGAEIAAEQAVYSTEFNADYFTGCSVTVGSKITPMLKTNSAEQTQTAFQPTEQASAASEDNAVTLLVTLKEGYEFVPTKVSVNASRYGTNGGSVDMKWVNGDGGTTPLLSGQTPERSADESSGTSHAPYYSTLSKTITNGKATTGTFGVKLHAYGIATNKQIGFCDLKIDGTLYSLTTGIRQVVGDIHLDGNYYTLQGVKVAQPKQGIYIHNGHKIVIK